MQQEIKDFARIHMIKDFPLFKSTSHEVLVEIARALKPVYIDPGETIIKYRDVGKEMFFIAYGTLEVLAPNGAHLVNINKGFFGELALFFNTKRTATIRALSYCSLFKLEKEDFEPIIKRKSELAYIVKHHIQKKLIEIPSLYKSLGNHEFQFEAHETGLLSLNEHDLKTAFKTHFPWVKLVYEQNKLHSTVQIQQELIQIHKSSVVGLDKLEKKSEELENLNTSYSETDKVIIQLTIIEARQLAAMDIGGRSDPFVVISTSNSTHRTKIKKRTLEPVWEEKFMLTVDPNATIENLLFDHDIIGSNDFLGAHVIKVNELPFGELMEYWVALEDTSEYKAKFRQGKLHVQILKSSLFEEDLIEFKMISGSDLIACDISGTSDPYCMISCDNEKYKTKVKIKNLNPIWNETCYFVANSDDSITVELYDLDYIGSDDIMGTLSIPIKDIPKNKRQSCESALQNVESGKIRYQITRIPMLDANINALKLSLNHVAGLKYSNSFSNRVLALMNPDTEPNKQIEAYSEVIKNEIRQKNYDTVEEYLTKIQDISTDLLGNLKIENIIIEFLIVSNQFSRAIDELKKCMKIIYPEYPSDQGPNSLNTWTSEKIDFLVQNKDKLIKLAIEYCDRKVNDSYTPSDSELEFIEFQQCVKLCGPALFVTSSPIAHAAQVLMGVLSVERNVFGVEASLSGIGYSILNQNHALSSKIIQFAEVDVNRAKNISNKLSYTGYFYATFMPFAQCNAYHQYEVLNRSFEDGLSTSESIFTIINGLTALFVSLHVSTNIQSKSEFLGLLEQLKEIIDDDDIYKCLLYDIENIYLTLVSGTHPVRNYPTDVENNILTRYFHNFSQAVIEYLRGNFRYSVKYMILANADVDALFPSVFYFYHIIWEIVICGTLNSVIPSDGGPVVVSEMQLQLDKDRISYVEEKTETLLNPVHWLRLADEARIENSKTSKEIINMYRRVISESMKTRLTIIANIAYIRLASFIRDVGFGPTFSSVSLQECYQAWHQFGAQGLCDMIYLSYDQDLLLHDSDDFKKIFSNQKPNTKTNTIVSESFPTMLHKDLKINFRELFVKELDSFVNFIGASRGCIIIKKPNDQSATIVCSCENNSTTISEAPLEEPQRKLLSKMEKNMKMVVVPDILMDRSFEYDIFLVQKNVKSLLAVPILECLNNKITLKGMIYFEKSQSFKQEDSDLISTLVENQQRTTRFEIEKLFLMKFLPNHILEHLTALDITPQQLKENQPKDYCVICKKSHSSTRKKYKGQLKAMQKKEMAVILPDLSNDALFHSSTVRELKEELSEKQRLLERQEKLIVRLLKEKENAADPSTQSLPNSLSNIHDEGDINVNTIQI
eukprot:CAMPEP_0117419848 /NCGR_PEP_ID=MMETSP0758-20121206/1320_1 /TAXON_ID=63605 /ORGANISM="Percolomonas cosmopolitus, Strain AE-1 (ATCC 50343)" /LENGTH=1345 /DNA_ID=CAMNT_0005201143 /DNA_START=565 /DNA_END=4602 /DNA_ORIENTATION=-